MTGKPDSIIARIAARQHGAVAREQLLHVGLTRHEIQRRIDSGALIPIHRGVYLVGYLGGSPLALDSAAILACKPRAMISHLRALKLWELPGPVAEEIDVTVVGRRPESPSGVRVHFLSELPRWELRFVGGLPITAPSLTLLDIANELRPDQLAEALNEARVQPILTEDELARTLRAHPLRPGAKALGKLLAGEKDPKISRSRAERRMHSLFAAHGLDFEPNFQIGPWEVDAFFMAERVAVEYDSRQFHDTPKRFVEDRRRIVDLSARGIQVLPFTWHDLNAGSQAALRRLTATLELRRAA